MSNFGKNLALWIIIGLILIALFNLFQGTNTKNYQSNIPFSDFIAQVEAGNISEVKIKGNNVEGFFYVREGPRTVSLNPQETIEYQLTRRQS